MKQIGFVLALIVGATLVPSTSAVDVPFGECTVGGLAECVVSSFNCPSSPPADSARTNTSAAAETPATVLVESQSIEVAYSYRFEPATKMVYQNFTMFSTCGNAATICTVAPEGYENAEGGYCWASTKTWYDAGNPYTYWHYAPTASYCIGFFDCEVSHAITVRLDVSAADPAAVVMVTSQDWFEARYCYYCGGGDIG